jgi:hypothetical protein
MMSDLCCDCWLCAGDARAQHRRLAWLRLAGGGGVQDYSGGGGIVHEGQCGLNDSPLLRTRFVA